jgi:NAD(P)-dependent dehydrogenase (short-subunit alcohol dehydrogenase family)
MSNRPVVVVTGATNGLGKLAALDVARGGADLAIVARNPEKADRLRQEVGAVAPDAHIDLFLADLSSIRDVHRVGREIAANYERIGVLVNNAGVHAFSQRITTEGLSEMIAVNYLAAWVLTDTLRASLISSAPSRIVTVASGAARRSGGINPAADLTRVTAYNRRESSQLYGRTKLMNIMFTMELGRQLAGTSVTVSCCDPGFNTTGLGRDLPLSGPLERILTRMKVGDPRRGAGIITRLATDPAATASGYFSVKDANPLDCPEPGSGETIQRDLWTATATLVADLLLTTT